MWVAIDVERGDYERVGGKYLAVLDLFGDRHGQLRCWRRWRASMPDRPTRLPEAVAFQAFMSEDAGSRT